jgi:hypothetical protein
VHVYRCSDEQGVVKVVDELRRRGVAITWDDDDDVRLVPVDSPGSKQVFSPMNVERALRQRTTMLSRVDVVTTTTQVMADLLRSHFDGPIEVIENYLDSSQYVRGRRSHEGIVIGWIASGEHFADVRKLDLTPMLRNVMARDDRVRVTTVGVKLDLDPARYTHIKHVPFHQLAACAAEFDIGIAPIGDHPMSYARSDIKVREYAAAGVPWVASARGPYAGLGRRRVGRRSPMTGGSRRWWMWRARGSSGCVCGAMRSRGRRPSTCRATPGSGRRRSRWRWTGRGGRREREVDRVLRRRGCWDSQNIAQTLTISD